MSCLFALDAHQGWVKSIVLKDKSLFSGSFDFHIKVSNINQGCFLLVIRNGMLRRSRMEKYWWIMVIMLIHYA